MARSSSSFTFSLACATLVLLGGGVTPVSAQPATSTSSSGTATTAPKPRQYPELQEGLRLLVGKHDLPAASKKFEDAARRYPELPSASVLMYQVLSQLGQPADARRQLEEAIKANCNDPEPYIVLGNDALGSGRAAEATTDFEKAKRLLRVYTNAERKASMEEQVLSGMALLAENRGDWNEAEARLRDYLNFASDDLVAHARLARVLFWQGKAAEAYDHLKKAKQIDRDRARKYRTLEIFLTPEAVMAQYYDQFEGPKSTTGNAEKWFRAAVKNAPDDLRAREVVANWALENGKIAFAKEQAEAALRIEAAHPGGYPDPNMRRVLRGRVGLWEKDWAAAEKYFEQIVLEDPSKVVAGNDFTSNSLSVQDSVSVSSVTLRNDGTGMRSAAGEQVGNGTAMNHLATTPHFGERNYLALALVEQEDPAKKQRALDYAEINSNENKYNTDALSTLGWVHFRRHEFDQAKLALDKAIKGSGGKMDPDTAVYMAHVLYHQGNKWQAKEILDGILKEDRWFSMRPEAQQLYEKVKDAARPARAAPAKTP